MQLERDEIFPIFEKLFYKLHCFQAGEIVSDTQL